MAHGSRHEDVRARRGGGAPARRQHSTSAPASATIPVTALDGAASGSPRRPRLLCVSPTERVAVHADAADLATVALAGAVLLPSATPPATFDDATPGVHLAAGAELTLAGGIPARATGATGDDAAIEASYHGRFVGAAGYVARDRVDVVYTAAAVSSPDGALDAELTGSVWLLDRPGGRKCIEIVSRGSVVARSGVASVVAPLGPAPFRRHGSRGRERRRPTRLADGNLGEPPRARLYLGAETRWRSVAPTC